MMDIRDFKSSVKVKAPKFDYNKFEKILQNSVQRTLDHFKLGLMRDAPENAKRYWEFVTANDERVCYICSRLDGNKYAMDDQRFRPPLHDKCRCRQHMITDPFELDKKEGKISHKHPNVISEEFGTEETEPKAFFRRNSFENLNFFSNDIKKRMGEFFKKV